MPGVDWIPGISQLKAGIQLITGDVDGAAETQKNFLQECPVISQATSLVQLAAGDSEGALETQKRCLGTVNNVANGLPVVGHVKGAVHHLCGDHEGGNAALNAATRTTVVMGSGAIAGITTGGIGAIPAGIAAGGAYDIASTIITDKPQGYIAAYERVKEDPSAGNIFDAACVHVGDGLAGYSGGEAATKLANKIEVSKLQAVRDVKQQQLDAGLFPEPKITTGEAVSMGKEINAITNKINALEGKTPTIDLKTGNQVPKNVSSTSTGTGGIVGGHDKNEKEKERNSNESKVNPSTSHNKCETQEIEGGVNTVSSSNEDETDDSVWNALKYDYYVAEETAKGPTDEEKKSKIQNYKDETVKKDAKSLKIISGIFNSTKKLLQQFKSEFEKRKNKNKLKELFSKRVWLHVCMPKEFSHTCAIQLNSDINGLYHSIIRHHDEWAHFIPSFETEFQHSNFKYIQSCLQEILEAENNIEARDAIRNYRNTLNMLRQENYQQFLDLESSFFDLQLDLYTFIQNNVTYENYLGEGVTWNNEVRIFFKVTDKQGNKKVMALGVSSNNGDRVGIFPPDEEYGDNRPIKRIETVFIMSWDTYLKQKVSKIFERK